MILFTSYHSMVFNHKNAISISGYAPDGWTAMEYKKLAPKKWIYDEYIRTKEATFYSLFYGIEVLSKLDPIKVADELGCGSILTCYEPAGQFCHRRLVSQWFNKHGIKCIELDPNWLMNGKFDKFVESGCQGDLDHI